MAVYWDSELHTLVDDEGNEFESNGGRLCAASPFPEEVSPPKKGLDFLDGVIVASAWEERKRRKAERQARETITPTRRTPGGLAGLAEGLLAGTFLFGMIGSLLWAIVTGTNIIGSIIILLFVLGGIARAKEERQ